MLGLGLGVNLQRVVISLINRLLSILKGRSTYFENESATKSLLNALNTDGLLEKASILITPTAYSDVKINSAKPIEATADLNFTRGSAGTRVNAQGLIENVDTLGSERVSNGDFSNGSTDWTKGASWSIANGVASSDGSSSNSFSQTSPILEVGKTYLLNFDLSSYSSGTLLLLGGSYQTQENFTSNGSYNVFIIPKYTTFAFYGSTFNGSIDNISVKEVIDVTNIPRINYKDGVGSWLIEPQSTNLYLNSALIVTQNITTLASSYTVSFYGTGTITFTGTYSGSLTGTGVNDRVSITFTTTSGTLTSTVSGTVTQGQAEEGNITSYIPTNVRGQTRLAETASRSGLGDLIDSTEGVFYAELSALNNDLTDRFISLSDGTLNNFIEIGYSSVSNTIYYNVTVSGVSQVSLSVAVSSVLDFNKIAVKFKANDFSLSVSSSTPVTSNSGSVPSLGILTKISISKGNGASVCYSNVKVIAVFKKALTIAEIDCLIE